MTLAVIKCGVDDYLRGRLKYRRDEHAFDFEPSSADELAKHTGSQGVASLSLGTLQLEVGIETGHLLYVWGYHPRSGWAEQELADVRSQTGCLRVLSDAALIPGVSTSLGDSGAWRTLVDHRSGWVSVEPLEPTPVEAYVEIADSVLVGLAEQRIAGLRLRPEYV
jgi:hypothetical protein